MRNSILIIALFSIAFYKVSARCGCHQQTQQNAFSQAKSQSQSKFGFNDISIDKNQALNANSVLNICPEPMDHDELISFYYQDEVTQLQVSDNSFTGLSQISDNMAMRGWNLNPDPEVSFESFIGYQILESRGKWATMTNPTYVPSSYAFRNWGGSLTCPAGSFIMQMQISTAIGTVIFIGLNCGTPDTTDPTQYDGECEVMDLQFENQCSDDFWMSGVTVSDESEQIICCKPLFTCEDSACSSQNTDNNWDMNFKSINAQLM
eukprot:403338781